ncbi:MAG: SDR family oxidoreductase [Deltaproteobacteria bacterium]|nr:SDR family oxidoreductase [Deltaproteobacteria bacterium]
MKRIAVVGATGYVGGRLVSELLRQGFHVRAVARSVEKLRCRTYAASNGLEITQADVQNPAELLRALMGCASCYWLINETGPWEQSNRGLQAAAGNLLSTAKAAGLSRIVYLGPPKKSTPRVPQTDSHCGSAIDPGEILASGSVPLTWLRTAMIIGAGSASFEILRYLTERLPIMVAPRWIKTPVRPIAVSDVIRYLAECMRNEQTAGLHSDIGGPDLLTFRDLIDIYSDAAGLPRRFVLTLPVRAIVPSAYWINVVTPVPFNIARPVVEILDGAPSTEDDPIRRVLPISLTSVRDAVTTALQDLEQHEVESCWSDAGALRPPEWLMCGDAPFAGGDVMDCSYRILLDCSPRRVWQVLLTLGGDRGWYFGNALWKMRGFLDRLVGGVGLSRGRRSAQDLRTGDAVDFWRILLAEENSRLILLAEMKVPGEAVLQFSLRPRDGGCELIQVARFRPKGVWGLAYWYAMAPFHDYLFRGMLRSIARNSGCAVVHDPQPFCGGGEVCRLPDEWGKTG